MQALRPREAAAYQDMMCRERCKRTCEKTLAEGAKHLQAMLDADKATVDAPALDTLQWQQRCEAMDPLPWPERLALHRESFDSLLCASTIQAALRAQQARQVAAYMRRRADRAPARKAAGDATNARTKSTAKNQSAIAAQFASETDEIAREQAIEKLQDPARHATAPSQRPDAFLKSEPQPPGTPPPAPAPQPLSVASVHTTPQPDVPENPAQPLTHCLECGAKAASQLDDWCHCCGEWLRKPVIAATSPARSEPPPKLDGDPAGPRAPPRRTRVRGVAGPKRAGAPALPSAMMHLL